MALETTNRSFGKYRLLAHLATGGMAEIYLATYSSLAGFEKTVVVKCILPNLAREKRFVEMFLDEARIAAMLNHPNVVQIFELGEIKGQYFMAMEYLSGESLATLIRTCNQQQRRLPPALAAGIVMQAAEGLHHAHTLSGKDGRPLNIVHRDVSPQNIFVLYDGGVKVVDFGIAKAATRSTHTQTGTLKGKLAYMSPEQVLHQELDGRSDVFSLGIVLWESLVQRKLFRHDREIDLLKAIVEQDAPSPRTAKPEVPEELEQIVLKALRRDRGRRYRSAYELRSDLAEHLRTTGAEADTAAISRFMQQLFAERIEKKRELVESARELDLELSDYLFSDPDRNISDTEHSVPRRTPETDLSFLDGESALQLDAGAAPRATGETATLHARPQRPVTGAEHLQRLRPRWFQPVSVFLAASLLAGIGLIVGYLIFGPGAGQAVAAGTVDAGTGTSVEPGAGAAAVAAGAGDAGALVDGASAVAARLVTDAAVHAADRADQQERVSKRTARRARRPPPRREAKRAQPASDDPTAEQPASGRLRLTTNPWTTIYFKGQKLGETPLIDVELPAGRVKLRAVNREAGIDRTLVVNIKPDERVSTRFDF